MVKRAVNARIKGVLEIMHNSKIISMVGRKIAISNMYMIKSIQLVIIQAFAVLEFFSF